MISKYHFMNIFCAFQKFQPYSDKFFKQNNVYSLESHNPTTKKGESNHFKFLHTLSIACSSLLIRGLGTWGRIGDIKYRPIHEILPFWIYDWDLPPMIFKGSVKGLDCHHRSNHLQCREKYQNNRRCCKICLVFIDILTYSTEI